MDAAAESRKMATFKADVFCCFIIAIRRNFVVHLGAPFLNLQLPLPSSSLTPVRVGRAPPPTVEYCFVLRCVDEAIGRRIIPTSFSQQPCPGGFIAELARSNISCVAALGKDRAIPPQRHQPGFVLLLLPFVIQHSTIYVSAQSRTILRRRGPTMR